jgi:nucleoside-diphosphate-sugar epimerase
MNQVLIVGCGDLGAEVANRLVPLGIKVTGVKRKDKAIGDFEIIYADVTQATSLQSLRHIQPQILIYCVAADGQTDEQYKVHYVDGFKNVLDTQIDNNKLQHVFFVSSTRVYGQVTDSLLDESVAAIPADFGGQRLLEAEQLLKTVTCGSTVLRLSGIYGKSRLRMVNLAQSPENWPKNSWSNRIHRDDAAAFILFLMQQILAGHQNKD